MARLAFLTHVPRSGSTLLGKLLDRYRDVAVSLEANLPDGIKSRRFRAASEAELLRELDRLYSDRKFSNWGLSKDDLRESLGQRSLPIDFSDLLPAVLQKAAEERGKRPKVCLFKLGNHLDHAAYLRKLFPSAQFLFVLRDPRAIYNSQRSAASSQTGKLMATNPLVFSLRYRKAHKALARYAGEPWLHIVRYEELVKSTQDVVSRALGFLGVDEALDEEGTSYEDDIPAPQRHLHPLIGEDHQEERADAWKDELDGGDIRLLQFLMRKHMERWSYELVEIAPMGLSQSIRTLRCVAELPLHSVRWLKAKLRPLRQLFWQRKH